MFAALAICIIWVMNKIDTDIKALGAQIESNNRRLDGHAQRIDQLYNTYIIESKSQSARTDILYKMFVDLLKETKKQRNNI